MEKETKEISFLYDADLITYLKLHCLEYKVQDDTIYIPYIQCKYLWMIAVNFGRYLTIKEVRKDFENKYNK